MNPQIHRETIESLERYAFESDEQATASLKDLDEFTARPIRIDYDNFARSIRKIATLHRRARFNGYGGGLLITGISGTGKSSILKYYQEHFPWHDEIEGRVNPVLFVETPSAPTVKNLAQAILRALGDPASSRGTSEDKTARIYKFFGSCRVELLLIDEFHHFLESNRKSSTRDVTDWLKNLLNVSRVGVVLAGLPSCEEALRSNQQLARRFSARLRLHPFNYVTPEGQTEFRGFLASLQSTLPIACGTPLGENETAKRVFVATNGVLDFVIKLLEEACDIARLTRAEQLDYGIFAQAFSDAIWADAPDELNPFLASSVLRPLTQEGEPFSNVNQVKVNRSGETKFT